MDGASYTLLAQAIPWAVLALLFTILHLEAKRRGSSIWSDIGTRGWIVALLATISAGIFGSIIVNGLQTASNTPPSWSTFFVEAPVLAGLASLVFLLARRMFLTSTPVQPARPS